MTQHWTCRNEDETAAAAADIADILPDRCILLLSGPLGAGKTAFCRALIRNKTGAPDLTVPSPTYTFVQTYGIGPYPDAIWHFDLYRMERPGDIYDLGWEEALQAGLCLIEWPERLGPLCPSGAWRLDIMVAPDDARTLTLTPSKGYSAAYA